MAPILTRQLKRTTHGPTLRIAVDHPQGDGQGGFGMGGTFDIASAGQDGDTVQMSDFAARVIMGDPGQAFHFICTPPIEPAAAPVSTKKDKPATKDQPTDKE